MGIVMHRSTESEVKVKLLSPVQLFATPWTVAYQAPPSMEFSMQEYWSRLPFPSLGDLPDPGIEPGSLALQADAFLSEPPGKSKERSTNFCENNLQVFLRLNIILSEWCDVCKQAMFELLDIHILTSDIKLRALHSLD